MKETTQIRRARYVLWLTLFFSLPPANAGFTLNVVDHDGNAVGGFRWLVEEDTAFDIQAGVHTTETLSLGFHKSHSPVIANGHSDTATATVDHLNIGADGRYYVSVLPYAGHAVGGASVSPGQTEVTVVVGRDPQPTAQITVFVFEDSAPINNAPDLPEEPGIDGTVHDFTVLLFDAAGQYGIAGGQVLVDAFGNPLGTEYAPGNPDMITKMGNGTIKLDQNGVAVIKNLAPAKYGVQVVPPAGGDWHQTSTIEGTKTIDAWVKAAEPAYFVEFGPPGPHVFFGFVHKTNDSSVLSGGSTLKGQIVNLHTSRPPDYTFYNGNPFPNCWVGLNDLAVGEGRGVYAQPCAADSTFSIPNVPPGNYQLVVWDDALDIIFGSLGVTVNADGRCSTPAGSCDFGEVPVFNWFSRYETTVFFDANGNGRRDEGEQGIPDQAVNLRFRDGRIYQSSTTDFAGEYVFEEVFPFFHWLVAEVDYARFKATGATIVVDAGGPINPEDPWTYDGKLNPQMQPDTGLPYRTELSEPGVPVLLEGIQGYLGQTSVIEWGKKIYDPGENGGVSGIVFYAVTRAENDPRFAVGEEWEPGIPRVQVNLYQDVEGDGNIDDVNGDGEMIYADVDNYPLDNFPGIEDVDHNGNNVFDSGDAVNIVWTDSWDDNLPTGCVGKFLIDGIEKDCYDGLRNFNQIRPALFDGGYGFFTYYPGGLDDPGSTEVALPAGKYVVETAVPPGYNLVKEEDKNVDFGVVPAPDLLPPVCIGEDHVVPSYLSLQTDSAGNPLPGIDPGDLIEAPFAHDTRKLCDRKQIILTNGQNAAADFFLFTETPRSAHVTGMILDDLANEFDPASPTFGEKYAPPWMPVSFRDWTGQEIARVYADEWGRYNALLPSTHTVNVPMPSGVSPNMITACMNDAGPIPDPGNPANMIVDPFYNRQYSQFCYTFQYMSGATTYLDTPVLPIAAFAGPDQFPLDCAHQNGTPLIHSVMGPMGDAHAERGQQITIRSAGMTAVPNPAFGLPGEAKTIQRDFGFGGSQGTVRLNGMALPIASWSNEQIVATIPIAASSGQLLVNRAGGGTTPVGLTLTVGPLLGPAGAVHHVSPDPAPGAHPIQDAIDAASAGDLIVMAPGTYDELVIMYKPVKLQGSGALSTIINARKAPGEKLQAWRDKVDALYAADAFDLVPGQETGFTPGDQEPLLFFAEEGAGIAVVARASGKNRFRQLDAARIDGLTVTGADHGGGIFVSGYADYLQISNNWVIANQGTFGGGIRIGFDNLIDETNQGLEYPDASNDHISIHHNHIAQNGNFGGAGAGISLYTGSDDYAVTENYICGNFAQGNGAGIGHQGLSDNGTIADNIIIFNQSFNQGQNVSGGGIFIGGAPPLGAGALTPGAGSVTVSGNLIQGNQAGAGNGGGIALVGINGEDAAGSRNNRLRWNRIDILNNFIVNNMAGLAGGGIALQDAARVRIFNDTVANNDSTATVGIAFAPGSPNESTPQPGAGIVARAHSAGLTNAIGNSPLVQPYKFFSNPELYNNIVWHNRQFRFAVYENTDPTSFRLLPDVGAGEAPVYSDLAVLPMGTGTLNPTNSVLTDATGYDPSNTSGDPQFLAEYVNGQPGQTIIMPELTTSLAVAPAFDEGGNFIDVRFGPLTPSGNYHIGADSLAIDQGTIIGAPLQDYDGEMRPQGIGVDSGADERVAIP